MSTGNPETISSAPGSQEHLTEEVTNSPDAAAVLAAQTEAARLAASGDASKQASELLTGVDVSQQVPPSDLPGTADETPEGKSMFTEFTDFLKKTWTQIAAFLGFSGVAAKISGKVSEAGDKIYQSIQEILQLPTVGERVAAMAEFAVRTNQYENAKHCWDWVAKVCALAHAKEGKTVFQVARYSPNGKQIGELTESVIAGIGKGDWLYIHNGNQYKNGDHSVVFLRWVDQGRKIAKVASFLNPEAGSKVEDNVDLNKEPIVRINKPVAV